MFVLYGIAARGSDDAVIDAYRANYTTRLADTTAAWSARLPQFVVPQDTWLQREMAWSYYYLRSGILKDDFFGLHIANQGGYYLYGLGLNAAMRDPLQHVLPLMYSDPGLAKETLVYVLRAMKQNGQIPYGIAGHGSWSNFPFDPSDMSLWLFWAASEYVCATRDKRQPTAGERLRGKASKTQFGRMCARLEIRIIAASSPQAKGRVERNNGVHQDRLVKKLRRQGSRATRLRTNIWKRNTFRNTIGVLREKRHEPRTITFGRRAPRS